MVNIPKCGQQKGLKTNQVALWATNKISVRNKFEEKHGFLYFSSQGFKDKVSSVIDVGTEQNNF